MDHQDTKSVLNDAYEKAGSITRSVLVVARLMGVKPEVLAKAVVNEDSQANYTAEFTAEVIKAAIAKEQEAVKASKKGE